MKMRSLTLTGVSDWMSEDSWSNKWGGWHIEILCLLKSKILALLHFYSHLTNQTNDDCIVGIELGTS